MASAVHQVLSSACKAIDVEPDRWAVGPKPELYGRTYVALASWIADRAVSKVATDRRAEHDELTTWARRFLAGETIRAAERKVLSRRFPQVQHGRALGRDIDVASPTVFGEGAALEALIALERDVSGLGARTSAAAAARLFGASFLDELAAEIFRLDIVTMIERLELDIGNATIAACVWRGATGAKGTHFIARLGDGRFGLIAKTKGRWTFTTGDRDDILATVPDALMASAADAIVGGGKKQESAIPRGEIASLTEEAKLAAVALNGEEPVFVFDDGRLGRWSREGIELSTASAGTAVGILVADDVITWGESLVRWKGTKPLRIGEGADSVLLLDDGRLVVVRDDHIAIGETQVMGLPKQRVLFDRVHRRLFAAAKSGVRVLSLDGKLKAELPFGADGHALSPDGAILAAWERGEKAKTVTLVDTESGKPRITVTVDKGDVDAVVFSGAHVAIRYHAQKRVAVFDSRGEMVHRLQARDLGARGAAVDFLFPLTGGDVLAFSPFPRGDMFLVRWDATLVTQWKLERFYAGGTSALHDAGDRVVFAHSNGGSRLLRITR